MNSHLLSILDASLINRSLFTIGMLHVSYDGVCLFRLQSHMLASYRTRFVRTEQQTELLGVKEFSECHFLSHTLPTGLFSASTCGKNDCGSRSVPNGDEAPHFHLNPNTKPFNVTSNILLTISRVAASLTTAFARPSNGFRMTYSA